MFAEIMYAKDETAVEIARWDVTDVGNETKEVTEGTNASDISSNEIQGRPFRKGIQRVKVQLKFKVNRGWPISK